MGLLDVAKQTFKTVEEAGSNLFHAAYDKASDTAKAAIDGGKSLISSAVDATAGAAGTIANLETQALSAGVGVTLSPLTVAMKGTSAASAEVAARTAVDAISTVAGAIVGGGVLGAGIALTQVAVNKWVSLDSKYTVQTVKSLDKDPNALEFDSLWNLYDGRKPADAQASATRGEGGKVKATEKGSEKAPLTLEVPDIFQGSKGQTVRPSDKAAAEKAEGALSHQYINARGETVALVVKPGEVRYSAKDSAGKTTTEARFTQEQTAIAHRGETAVLDKIKNELHLTTPQLELLQKDGNQQIKLNDGRQIIKDAQGIRLTDSTGKVVETISDNQVQVAPDVFMVSSGANLDEEAKKHSQKADTQSTTLLVSADGSALALLPGGIKVEVRKDKSAIIKTPEGRVFLREAAGKLLVLENGKFVPLAEENKPAGTALQDGGMRTGNLEIAHGRLRSHHIDMDLVNHIITMMDAHNQQKKQATVKLDTGAGVQVETPEHNISASGNTVTTSTTDNKPVATWNFENKTLETKEVTIAPDKTVIKESKTEIRPDNSVEFEGGQGPVLKPDGSAQLDEKTTVDKNGNVESGNWRASAGFRCESVSVSSVEHTALTKITGANASAQNVYNKALNGMVTMADLSELNANLSDVTALIQQLTAVGNTALVGELQNSYAKILETINFALPKAQAAQVALDRGITSPFIIKQIEDGTVGSSPQQAARSVLAA